MRCVCQLCGAGVFHQMTGFPIYCCDSWIQAGPCLSCCCWNGPVVFCWGRLGSLVVGAVLDELFGMMEFLTFYVPDLEAASWPRILGASQWGFKP